MELNMQQQRRVDLSFEICRMNHKIGTLSATTSNDPKSPLPSSHEQQATQDCAVFSLPGPLNPLFGLRFDFVGVSVCEYTYYLYMLHVLVWAYAAERAKRGDRMESRKCLADVCRNTSWSTYGLVPNVRILC